MLMKLLINYVIWPYAKYTLKMFIFNYVNKTFNILSICFNSVYLIRYSFKRQNNIL